MGAFFSVTASGTALPTPLVTKNGGDGTYISYVAFHPATELGAVVLISDSNPQLANGNSTFAFDVLSEIFDDLIPEVSSTNSEILLSLYSGTYTCERANPVLIQNFGCGNGINVTLQVVGGSVTVTNTMPDYGLIAAVYLSLLVDGVSQPQVLPSSYSSSLVLKTEDESIFWAYPYLSCIYLGNGISSNEPVRRPIPEHSTCMRCSLILRRDYFDGLRWAPYAADLEFNKICLNLLTQLTRLLV